MPGPPPKHPSRRNRGGSTASFKQLPSLGIAKSERPSWPLKPDVELAAELDQLQDKITNLNVELADCEDGRQKGRLRRDLNAAELREAILRAKIAEANESEVDLWDRLWSTPQAALWSESTAFQRSVAVFVRYQIRAEQGDLKSASEARQMSDRLGLSPLALQRLRAEVENAEAAEDRGKARRSRSESVVKKKPGGDDPRLTLVG